MASYIELHDIRNQQDVVRKIHGAICHVAFDILAPESGTTPARTDWAKAAIKNPAAVTPEIVHFVLLANISQTAAVIIAAADSAYKTNVAAAVNKLIGPAS